MAVQDEFVQSGEAGKSFYPIERKLVIAVTSSALFDMTESNRVFVEVILMRFSNQVWPSPL